jgi:hypothetical protein
MRRRSTILQHPSRLTIERQYLQGRSIASIAREHSVTIDSLKYHFEHNLSRQLVKAFEVKEMTSSMDLLSEIDYLVLHTKNIFKRNYDAGRDLTALKALDSQRSTLELLCKISALMHQTKLLDLQEKQEVEQHEQNDDYSDRLKILTFNELEMLLKIQRKLKAQDPKMIIIPDTQKFTAENGMKRTS